MALPVPVSLPPTALPGGLLASASPLGAALAGLPWTGGVEFLSDGCLTPERVAICPERYVGELDTVGSIQFLPFDMRQGVKCSSLSRLDVGGVAAETLDVTDEFLMAQELRDGLASGNPCLIDAPVIGTGVDLAEAISLIEAAGALALAGRLIVIHVPPLLAITLPDICYRDAGGNWRTPFGSLVVTSPGYYGTTTVYGTGEVYYAIGEVTPTARMDRALNVDEGWAERPGIVVFDPCFLAAVNIDDSPGQV